MVFADILVQTSFLLACQPRSSMMVLRHTDVSATESHYVMADRTEIPLAIEKLEAALGEGTNRATVSRDKQISTWH
jgi:hypothetical protein